MKKFMILGILLLGGMRLAQAVESPVLGPGYLETPVPWTRSGAGLSLHQLFESKPLVNVTGVRGRFAMAPWELSLNFETWDDDKDTNIFGGLLKYVYPVATTTVGGFVGATSLNSDAGDQTSMVYGVAVGVRQLNFAASAGWLGFSDQRVVGGTKDEQENEIFVNASFSIPGGFGIFAEWWNLSEVDASGWTTAAMYEFLGGLTLIGGWRQVSNAQEEGQAFAAVSYIFSMP